MNLHEQVEYHKKRAAMFEKDYSPAMARVEENHAEIARLKIQIRECQDDIKCQLESGGY